MPTLFGFRLSRFFSSQFSVVIRYYAQHNVGLNNAGIEVLFQHYFYSHLTANS